MIARDLVGEGARPGDVWPWEIADAVRTVESSAPCFPDDSTFWSVEWTWLITNDAMSPPIAPASKPLQRFGFELVRMFDILQTTHLRRNLRQL